MWTEEQLKSRALPPLRSREEMKQILLENEYGFMPDIPYNVTYGETKQIDHRMAWGTANYSKTDITISSEYGSHTFPVYHLTHEDGKKHPFFVYISIHSQIPSIYIPIEEIAGRGVDLFCFGYQDVTADSNDNFLSGIANVFFGPKGRTKPNDAGKLRMWAFAASKVLDFALTFDTVDPERSAVMGHSRLGKTALVAGMTDERFKFVCSNDSGCSGASVARGSLTLIGKEGEYGGESETIAVITKVFPHWFCPNYYRFAKENVPDIFDQHWLIACSAPRYVCVSSADFDSWADPTSEYVSCIGASKAWEEKGLPGFIHPDSAPVSGEAYQEGSISYFKRHGCHFMSREDWNKYIDFIEKKCPEK